jgi:hypothetical protein
MAVVSLAVQLVGSVRDIRRFLAQVSDAPKELQRLVDLPEQLELILQNVGMVVENQRKNNERGDVDVSPSVLRAIQACERKVAILEGLVETAKCSSSSSKKTTRALGSFKLACKKKEIEEFESQLLSPINLLNLAMTTNLTWVLILHTKLQFANLFLALFILRTWHSSWVKPLLPIRSQPPLSMSYFFYAVAHRITTGRLAALAIVE